MNENQKVLIGYWVTYVLVTILIGEFYWYTMPVGIPAFVLIVIYLYWSERQEGKKLETVLSDVTSLKSSETTKG